MDGDVGMLATSINNNPLKIRRRAFKKESLQ